MQNYQPLANLDDGTCVAPICWDFDFSGSVGIQDLWTCCSSTKNVGRNDQNQIAAMLHGAPPSGGALLVGAGAGRGNAMRVNGPQGA